jgi:hypothetical protein
MKMKGPTSRWPGGDSPGKNPDKFRRLGYCLAEQHETITRLCVEMARKPELEQEVLRIIGGNHGH